MPEAVNTSGRRKVRCPKCTACLTEPPTLIYQCPICSTLLLAKGNPDDSNDKSSKNKLRGDGRDAENIQESPEGGSKVEKATVVKESIQTQRHRGMEYMENEKISIKESNRPFSFDSPDETTDDGVFKYMQEDVPSSILDEQPLYRRKDHRPKPLQMDAFIPKDDSLSSEMPLYSLRWRSAHSSVRSCESSDKSEQGKDISGLESPSYDGFETEIDLPGWSSENSNVAELPEITTLISQVEGFQFEDNSCKPEVPRRFEQNELECDHVEIDNRGETLQEATGQVVERCLEVCFHEGSGNDRSVMTGPGELNCDTVNSDDVKAHERDESFVDLGHSMSDRHPLEVAGSSQSDRVQGSLTASSVRNDSIDDFGHSLCDWNLSEGVASNHTHRSQGSLTDSCVQNETVVDLENSSCDQFSVKVADSGHIDGLRSRLTGLGFLTSSVGNSKGTNSEQSGGTKMTPEPIECRRQQLQDDNVRDSVSDEGDGIGDDRNQCSEGLPSTLSEQAKDSKVEVSLRYADCLTERLVNTQVSDSLDLSLYDRQSLQFSKVNASSKENCSEADLADEKRVVDSNMAVLAGLPSKDGKDVTFSTSPEVTRLAPRFLNEKEVSAIQNQALSGMNKSDGSNTIFMTGSGAHVQKSAVQQKFLQRTEEELTDHMQLYHSVVESGANICNAPFVGDYQSHNLSTMDKIDRSDMGTVVSNKHWANISNLDLIPPSKIEDINRKHAPSSWREKPVTVRHACFREDGHFRKDFGLDPSQGGGDGVVGQETALADPSTFPDISAGNVFVPGHWSRSYHHLEKNVVSPESLQLNDLEGKVSTVSRHQKPTSGNFVDAHMAGLNPNRKGLHAQQGKYLKPEFCVQPHSVRGNWQEHPTHLQSQNFHVDPNAMEQGPRCLFCGPANTSQGYSARCEESMPHCHPNEQYLSDISGLSSSTASSRAYPFKVASQGLMLPAAIHEQVFSQCAHHSVPPVSAFSMHQPQMRQQMLQKQMQHNCAACFSQSRSMMEQQPVLHEGWESWGLHTLPSSYANSSVGHCQTRFLPTQGVRHNRAGVQIQSQAPLARRRKHYPPLPGEGSAPYVLCQDCNQLLQVPACLPPNSENVQKLRCGACGKVSRFSIHDLANNNTLSLSFQSSNVSSATNSMVQVTSVPHLVQPSTVYKVHPETSTIHRSAHGSFFPSNNNGRWLPISKATQSVEPSCHQASYGMTNFASSLHSPCERVAKNHMSHQTNASARTISVTDELDDMCVVRPVTGVAEGHELSQSQMRYGDGDSFLSSSGMPSEYYLSSLPSNTAGVSLPGNASVCQANEPQNVEAGSRERAVFGGRKMSIGLLSRSTMDELDRPGFEAPAISNDYFQKHSRASRANFSPTSLQDSPPERHRECSGDEPLGWSLQGSLPEHQSECFGDEPLGCDQLTLTVESPQQERLMESDFSRSTSKSSATQLSKWSAAPGSLLFKHSTHEPAGLIPGLKQRSSLQDFGNGMRSAPWSPAPGSPLYDHLKYDASSDFDERSCQKEQDVERVHANRGPKYLASLLKKSFRDFGKGSQVNNNRRKVMINGRLIPDAAVKKAEEQAGSIHPGSYWYDYQAGFWGIMGGHCLGIISPFIEELNVPLAKDCAGGKTGVLVNGRELHHKDLEVLARRGLPTTPGKSYIVDISGQVVDDASGQRLRSLGKLAPTVERKGRGHGMFQPSGLQLGSLHNHV